MKLKNLDIGNEGMRNLEKIGPKLVIDIKDAIGHVPSIIARDTLWHARGSSMPASTVSCGGWSVQSQQKPQSSGKKRGDLRLVD